MGRRNRLLVGACLVVGCGTILRASGASALTATDGPAAHHQTGNLQKGCCANRVMTMIIIIVLVVLLLGGGGGYYGYSRYGRQGAGGVVGLILIILLVIWLFGGLQVNHM